VTPGEFIDSMMGPLLECGGFISSWYRSKKHNTAVGGHTDSQHLVGLAMDVVDFPSQEDKDRFIRRCKRMGYGVIDETNHVHVQAYRLH
jgi:uncharacterized protein YcbK (DUF882 family)